MIALPVWTESYGISTRSTRWASGIYPDLYQRIGPDPQGFNVLYPPNPDGLGVFRRDDLKKSIDQMRQYALDHPDTSIRMPLPIPKGSRAPKNLGEILETLSVLPDNVIVVSRLGKI